MELFSNSHLPPTSSHLDAPQIDNCNSNSRLVVDEYDNGKFRLERVKDPLKTRSLIFSGPLY